MKKKIKSLVRKACNRIFLMLAQGIIEKKPDGTIHIQSDVIVNGNITGKKSAAHETMTSDKNISFHKKTSGIKRKEGLFSEPFSPYHSKEN